VACNSDTVKNFATEKGSVAVCIYGEEAEAINEQAASLICWMLYDGGFANIEPSQFGIPRPYRQRCTPVPLMHPSASAGI